MLLTVTILLVSALAVAHAEEPLMQLLTMRCDGSMQFMKGFPMGPLAAASAGAVKLISHQLDVLKEEARCGCNSTDLTDELIEKSWFMYSPKMMLRLLEGPDGAVTLPCDFGDDPVLTNSLFKIVMPSSCDPETGKCSMAIKLKGQDLALGMRLERCDNSPNFFASLYCSGVDCAYLGSPCSVDKDCQVKGGNLKCKDIVEVPICEKYAGSKSDFGCSYSRTNPSESECAAAAANGTLLADGEDEGEFRKDCKTYYRAPLREFVATMLRLNKKDFEKDWQGCLPFTEVAHTVKQLVRNEYEFANKFPATTIVDNGKFSICMPSTFEQFFDENSALMTAVGDADDLAYPVSGDDIECPAAPTAAPTTPSPTKTPAPGVATSAPGSATPAPGSATPAPGGRKRSVDLSAYNKCMSLEWCENQDDGTVVDYCHVSGVCNFFNQVCFTTYEDLFAYQKAENERQDRVGLKRVLAGVDHMIEDAHCTLEQVTDGDDEYIQLGCGADADDAADNEGFAVPTPASFDLKDGGENPVKAVATSPPNTADLHMLAHVACDGTASLLPGHDWLGFSANGYGLLRALHLVRKIYVSGVQCRAESTFNTKLSALGLDAYFNDYWVGLENMMAAITGAKRKRKKIDGMSDLADELDNIEQTLALPKECSYESWYKDRTCALSISFFSDSSLFGVPTELQFYARQCPGTMTPELGLQCKGAPCKLFSGPALCTTDTDCAGNQVCYSLGDLLGGIGGNDDEEDSGSDGSGGDGAQPLRKRFADMARSAVASLSRKRNNDTGTVWKNETVAVQDQAVEAEGDASGSALFTFLLPLILHSPLCDKDKDEAMQDKVNWLIQRVAGGTQFDKDKGICFLDLGDESVAQKATNEARKKVLENIVTATDEVISFNDKYFAGWSFVKDGLKAADEGKSLEGRDDLETWKIQGGAYSVAAGTFVHEEDRASSASVLSVALVAVVVAAVAAIM